MSPQILALGSAIAYAFCIISARRGLRFSNATTVTYLSLSIHTFTLWPAVFLLGGIPAVSSAALFWFLFTGSFQFVIRHLTYLAIKQVGASRSYALRATAPLFSAVIAVLLLGERVTPTIVIGTLLIVAGIAVISWERGETGASFPWWRLAVPLAAALIAGVVQPMRRYALTLADEPLFFSAIVGAVSLFWYLLSMALSSVERPKWEKKALAPFISAGLFETLGILLGIASLSHGSVVVVTPIVSTSPMWVLIGSALFLRDVERVRFQTVVGTLCVVAGTVIIAFGG
jgi:drug/metabolite transporter (DMT)-like permease